VRFVQRTFPARDLPLQSGALNAGKCPIGALLSGADALRPIIEREDRGG